MHQTAANGGHEAAEHIAIQALAFLAVDSERIGRFLTLTGIDPGDVRRAAESPRFLTGVLDYLLADEALLLTFAANCNVDPSGIAPARAVLANTIDR